MQCPRCKIELVLQEIQQAGITAYSMRCEQCGGHWFTPEQLVRLANIVEVRLVEIRRIPNLNTQMALLVCPHCEERTILHKVLNQRNKNVVMDACYECCGIWLDGGKLEAIQEEGLFTAVANLWKWLKEQ